MTSSSLLLLLRRRRHLSFNLPTAWKAAPTPHGRKISSPARAMNNGWYKHCYCVAIRLVIVPDSHALRNTFATLGQEWIAQALALRNSDDDDVDKSPRGNYHQAAL